jgi:hypothetical protein
VRVRGTVVGVDRTNNWALVTPATAAGRPGGGLRAQGAPIKCGLRDGQWPPPFSKVWIESHSSSNYQIVGSISDRRLLVHDDFTHVDGGNPAVGDGDTPWRATNLVASASGQQTGVGQGVYILVTPATAGASQAAAKDDSSVLIQADPAVWYSAKITTSVATNCIVHCGFAQADANINFTAGAATDRTAQFLFDTTVASPFFRATNGTSVTDILVPYTVVANTFWDLDIVCVGGGYVAGWINGDGPYIITTNVPAVGGAFEPYFGIYPRAAAQQDIRVDWVHAETFTDPVPATLLFR